MSFAQAGFPIKPVCVRVQENVQRAGEWGAGGALSDVDTVISVCIRSHTPVCSPACNRWMNGKKGDEGLEMDVVLLVGWFFIPRVVVQKLKRNSLQVT